MCKGFFELLLWHLPLSFTPPTPLMIDINFLRADKGGDIDLYESSFKSRSSSASSSSPKSPLHDIIELDVICRALNAASCDLRAERAKVQKTLKAILKSESAQDASMSQKLADLKAQLKVKAVGISCHDAELKAKRSKLNSLLREGKSGLDREAWTR